MAKMRNSGGSMSNVRKVTEMVVKGPGPADLMSNGRMRNRNMTGTANPQAPTRSDGRVGKFK